MYTPALGYWNNPEGTEKLLRGGWLHTGDQGLIDAENNLFVRARRNDLIVRGGANVYPAEVEYTIQKDLRIKHCAVLGVPDERLGQRVAAVLEFQDVTTAKDQLLMDLHEHCARHLARFKVPSDWFVTAHMPLNAMHKVMKPVLLLQMAEEALGLPWRPPKPDRPTG